MIPILIPIKSISKRCPNKNKLLLPSTLWWLSRVNNMFPCWILTDDINYIDIAEIKRYGLPFPVNIWAEEDFSSEQMEFTSIKKFIEWYNNLSIDNRNKYGYKLIDSFIWCPVTNPCRSVELYDNIKHYLIESDILNEYDLLTSYNIITDRSIFELEGDKDIGFKHKGIERKGCYCIDKKIADGSIYCTTKRFIDKVISSDNPNKTFWNSKIKFIYNEAPMVDIDTIREYNEYKNFYKQPYG